MRRALRKHLLQTLVEEDLHRFVVAEADRRGLAISSYLRQLVQEQSELPPDARLAVIEAQIEGLRALLHRREPT